LDIAAPQMLLASANRRFLSHSFEGAAFLSEVPIFSPFASFYFYKNGKALNYQFFYSEPRLPF
jgi:hypothetical protein